MRSDCYRYSIPSELFRKAQRDHGDIVLLAELLRSAGDAICGLRTKRRGALETEELAGLRTSLGHAIGEQYETFAILQSSLHKLEILAGYEAQRQRWNCLQL